MKEELKLRRFEYVREYRGVEFVFTKEHAQIEKFMQLYADLYKKDPKLIGFRDFCDDELSNYVGERHTTQLLMKNGECIGGARITLRPKGQDFLLPLEMDLADGPDDATYLLKNMLPELDIDSGCAEVSRLVLAPEYRGDTGYAGSMFLNFFVFGLDVDARYMFVLTDGVRSRMYCKLMKKLGQLDGHIFKNLPVFHRTYFEGVKMRIVGWDKYNRLKEVYTSKGTPK